MKDAIRGVLFDLSGVLYVGDRAVPGAREGLESLRRREVPVRFVTNVSRRPARRIVADLHEMGLAIDPDDLFTAPHAAHRYLREHDLRPFLLIHQALEEEFSDLSRDAPNAVLLGDAGERFTYDNLNRAFRVLVEGAPLLTMGDNRYFREDEGLSLDIGPFAAALEYAADTRATVLGKPAPQFFAAAVASIGCKPPETVMVGDDALADVDGALRAGLQGILVQTGKYRSGDEARIEQPGAVVVSDVVAAVDWIVSRL
ncbi:MAG: TIGR01458 family HAD-type hydrolase [Gammaproteobacteria bacterium]|nr:TIGR01458 family HAD-type hydrolase [Gammaproteobacteria bacterium]NIR83281.1 TIGR01458 family HAD-type hydrolase [Gammaproteobacteria bacterium]NIR91081.1 TIGR01458 family HAD-type hydrolase [Gammaproteobacteria bacterium]NIU04448.1 TIGR01458 family HAD-type hydrolase [Gammaproteobacteria bacterium]NIW87084.1 TIGR01458 family HAD-type hydrolase [Gammaproteobacteria bacterium]